MLLCEVHIIMCSNAAYGFSQNYDVRTKSDITAAQLDARLENRLKGTGCYFIAAQEEYGINAEFLAAIAIHESGNGSSVAARRKNNFFGLMGSRGQLSFATQREGIMTAAKTLTKTDGYYFGRGRYTIRKIGQRYASDKRWSSRVVTTMKSIR